MVNYIRIIYRDHRVGDRPFLILSLSLYFDHVREISRSATIEMQHPRLQKEIIRKYEFLNLELLMAITS